MPLVVPGLQSANGGGDDKTSKWMNDLLGKTIGDTKNETVCALTSKEPMEGMCIYYTD